MSELQGGVECQARDIALLRDLFVSRIMTLVHITALHFEGRGEAAKKRVQKLKAAGLIAERPRKARDPSILFLARRGFDLLNQGGHLSEYPRLSVTAFERRARVSDLTLRHELEVMDAKAAIASEVGRVSNLEIVEFSTWPLLLEFDVHDRAGSRVRVKPDGFLRVEQRESDGVVYEHTFFLEVDRGTETLDTLCRRSHCYREHYATGGYAASLGASRGSFTEFPFRVLIVLPSVARLNNLLEALLSLTPPIETQVWATTSADLNTDPLGAIWIRPRDFRDAFAGPWPAGHFDDSTLRRRVGRNRQTHAAVVRHSLFAD